MSLRVIQPWGEYINSTTNQLPPIQFIDTLRRSGVHFSEVNLDIQFGNSGLRSQPRDLLAVSQLLDHWSLLQLPTNVMLSLPDDDCMSVGEQNPDRIAINQADWLESMLLI